MIYLKNKIIKFFFLGITSSLLIYLLYRSKLDFLNEYYLKYFILNFILIFFSILFIFIHQKKQSYLIFIFFCILFTLYGAEGYLGYKYINNFNTSLENRKSNITKKYNDYLNLKNKYKNIEIRVLPRDFLYEENQKLLPLSTFSNKKIFNCNENGYYPLWDSDRFGFNNPDYLWNENEVEYLIIGDSYAMGQCVYEKNSISGNFRALSPKNTVINLAIAGNGPLLEFAILKEYMNIVNPKKILWFFSEVDDLSNLLKESKNKILMDYFLKDNFSQNLVMRQDEINDKLNEKLSKSLSEIKNEKNFYLKFDIPRFIKLYTVRELTINTIFKKEDPLDSKFKEIMLKAKIFAEKNNAEFYFIYLPQFSRYSSYYSYPNVKNSKKIIKIINDLNIKLIDIHDELFAKQPDPLDFFPFRSTGHYNENGYKQIAITIHDKINKNITN